MAKFYSLDEVKALGEEQTRKHQERVFVVRKLVDGYWWVYRLIRNPPRPHRQIFFWWQRLTRGYSDRDWWSFDQFLARIIADACRKFREEGHTYPGDLGTPEEWHQILTKIEEGFKAHIELFELDYISEEEKAQQLVTKQKEAVDLLGRYFGSLWD